MADNVLKALLPAAVSMRVPVILIDARRHGGNRDHQSLRRRRGAPSAISSSWNGSTIRPIERNQAEAAATCLGQPSRHLDDL
jgi:hypothetical protein